MQISLSCCALLFTSLGQISTCRLVLPNLIRQAPSSLNPIRIQDKIQTPIMPVIPSNNANDAEDDNMSTPHKPTLYDTLPLTRRINIFSSLVRDHPNLPTLLGSHDNNNHRDNDQNPTSFTILAPLNSALQSLEHKPWEDSNDYATFGERAYDGQGGEERAKGNLKSFVERHVVPQSPWRMGEKVKNLAGREVWWEEREEEEGGERKKRVIMPQAVEVDEVVSKAGNGEVWVLKGVLGG
ncbi:hypothetical protein GJ744_008488 [Endocarpon pusillum]|uniref:FAS1 domain-containing protein n=1 Tax=Endocarpon pusillum TaxID=364733 RepID=A0A8H7E4D0_9EURO|nr:hypothetical protein GJ744_008488 [Endocarpon pusillum]